MSLRITAPLAFAAAGALALAGCGSGNDDKGNQSGPSSPSASSSAAGTSKLSSVSVTAGAAPKLSLRTTPFSTSKTAVKVVKAGTGAPVRKGQSVAVNYVLVDGRDGKQAQSTFGKPSQAFPADPQQVLPGIAKGLIDQRVGSRVLVGMSPEDGFGAQGNQQLGIQAGDSMLMLVDIKSAHSPLAHAQGTAVAPKAGLPTVKVDPKDQSSGSATITVPHTTAPTTLVVQPLIKGTGAAVKSGQTVSAKYTGVIWASGKVFDSTSKHGGQAAPFPIGVGQVIPGWDKGLVGQRVGSRLLLVVPPKEGYNKDVPDAGIKKNDTLVFAIDIVDAS